MSTKLTTHLVHSSREAYTAAVEHPFLTASGTSRLPKGSLDQWLSQDRIYAAHAYPQFIGRLISRIPFSSADPISSAAELQNQRVLKILTYALANVVREAAFFIDLAEKHALRLDGWGERAETKAYVAEMERFSRSASFEEGLVFLWAMEQVYLDAWTYVGKVRSAHADALSADAPNAAAVAELVDNWTNSEFHEFVADLANLVDDRGIEPGSERWAKAEKVWATVLDIEKGFWPPVEGA
ncbi:hypothetical protein PLICRDRAFT_112328 [Plicaturopsis crispa FD-325 SS-3]|nr:hypothetical protein PLICRDRAFT_112328 [Plicaturopsis crispa FD-325 SS-3]